jgi:hypothetical protein
MSRLYGPVHRSLQDRFDTRRLADNVETRAVPTEIPQEHKAFIESRDAQMPDLYIEGVAGRRRRTLTRSMSIRPTGAWTGER